ncbi:aminodeoxychorismate lyase [Solibacillus sp. CAU 1738]|uniref:aminodeoxychorismate lyase n=1 Tax=Solibacillus sp. CAU 1738 TaxID=3140363 RepID=UPI0032610CCD
MICWMNGSYMDASELTISPFDHGFLYGLGFFETLRTYEQEPVFLQEHFNRLSEALAEYRIQMPYTLSDLREVIKELDVRNGGEDGYFRINVSAGVHDLGLAPTHYPKPNVIVFRKPLVISARGTEKSGVWLQTSRNTPETDIRHKSHHYGNNVRARMELPNLAHYEGFFCTDNGIVTEGITSNIFWARNDILYTPSIDTGILPGITRGWVLKMAEELGYNVREGFFNRFELEDAHECFITNSVQELVPISQIGNVCFAGEEGPVYQRIHRAYVDEIMQIVRRS